MERLSRTSTLKLKECRRAWAMSLAGYLRHVEGKRNPEGDQAAIARLRADLQLLDAECALRVGRQSLQVP